MGNQGLSYTFTGRTMRLDAATTKAWEDGGAARVELRADAGVIAAGISCTLGTGEFCVVEIHSHDGIVLDAVERRG